MITLRKLASLKEDTRRRKYPLLLQQFERDIKTDKSLNSIYLKGLLHMIYVDKFYSDIVISEIISLDESLEKVDKPHMIWRINSLRHKLLQAINAEPGDWDFEENNSVDRSKRISGEISLYLDGIRSPFNVGSIFRSAESFGIGKIFLSHETVSPEHSRAKRSSMGCVDLIPWSYLSINEIIEPVFALELGGESLDSFVFPKTGTLVIGSEELGVSPDGIALADKSLGRLSIRTGGVKGSINVSVATGIALQKWYSSIW